MLEQRRRPVQHVCAAGAREARCVRAEDCSLCFGQYCTQPRHSVHRVAFKGPAKLYIFHAASGRVRTAPKTMIRPRGACPLPPPQLHDTGPNHQKPMAAAGGGRGGGVGRGGRRIVPGGGGVVWGAGPRPVPGGRRDGGGGCGW